MTPKGIYHKLPNDTWGVKVEGQYPETDMQMDVEVTTKDGEIHLRRVRLTEVHRDYAIGVLLMILYALPADIHARYPE